MDSQLKLVLDEIKGTLTSSMDDLKTSLSARIDGVEKNIGDRIRSVEEAAQVFKVWKPKVDSSMEDLRGEIGALRKSVSQVVLDSTPPSSAGIFAKPTSAAALPSAGNPVDGPHGHRHDSNHREGAYGPVYTHTHSPVKGMSADPTPSFYRSSSHPHLPMGDPSCKWSSEFTRNSTNSGLGKLPKIPFPTFDGDNPKLWIRQCENYFDMYDIDTSYWYKIASMHFKVAAGRWLQSVETKARSAS